MERSQEVDSTIADVAQEFRRDSESIRKKTMNEYDSLVGKAFKEFAGKVLDAASAMEPLHQIRCLLEKDLIDKAQRFSRMRWLWYFRRAPLTSIFSGTLPSTFSYDTFLLETLCGFAPNEQRGLGDLLRYPINSNDIRRCLQLCHGIQYLSQIHVYLRFAGKGASIKFSNVGPVQSITDSAIREGIRLYDARVANSGFQLTKLGSFVGAEYNKELTLVSYFRLDTPQFLPPLFSKDFREVTVLSNCAPKVMSLSGFSQLAQDPALASIEFLNKRTAALLLFLIALPEILVELDAAPKTLMKNGYFLLSNESLESAMASTFQKAAQTLNEISGNIPVPNSASEALTELRNITPSLWPIDFPSPLIPIGNDAVCCDVVIASSAFLKLCEFPRLGGAAANARANHFELATQEVINKSAYKPSDEVLKLRGRSLTLKGKVITDIDAIGAKDDTLLLVQCKSLVYSDEYDMGEKKAIINSWSTVENGLVGWKKRIEEFEHNRVGDDYDFSAYKKFISVLCTPQPIYVPAGQCTEEVAPGLRATCTPQELSNFLSHA